MDNKNINFSVDFVADIGWNPLDPGCWVYCPLSALIKLGEECPASKAYRKEKLVICPLAKHGITRTK